ncbi:MAG TPA: hypothetical protein VGK02_07565 [Candidatus Aquicultor sp.]|jgi:hypothetical protein
MESLNLAGHGSVSVDDNAKKIVQVSAKTAGKSSMTLYSNIVDEGAWGF